MFSVRRVGRFLPGSLWGPLTNVKLDRLAFLQATKAAYLQHFVSPNQQVVIGTRNVESATLKSLSIQRQAAFETFVLFQPGEQGFRRALRRQVLNYEDRCREAVRQLLSRLSTASKPPAEVPITTVSRPLLGIWLLPCSFEH